jgi:mannose-6-phosphate isomerase
VSDPIRQIFEMKNPIQTYAWGSRTAIARLLGQASPTPEPQAELWMGAHPKSPSEIRFNGRWRSLLELIDRYPNELLGRRVADRFKRSLPYLFKVLAAAEPLSIQAHPDQQQAMDGFRRENRQGLSLADPRRNYRDERPKPECMCALTPFVGLCGFRSPEAIMALGEPVWPRTEAPVLEILRNGKDDKVLQDFFQLLMQMDPDRRAALTHHVASGAAQMESPNEVYRWIGRLHQKYPGDVGVLSPLMLNLITLQPGEAVFLPPGQLHAYLDGLGIEVMANSDNVLRGGLTPKHIDVRELVRILDFHPYNPKILSPQQQTETEGFYESLTDTFRLSRLIVTGKRPHVAPGRPEGPEIILGVEGTAVIRNGDAGDDATIGPGASVFIPAAVDAYTITGDARLFKAAVNPDVG